jgi:hypothetical protein
MTIAISLKVNDGVILASDSAATIWAQAADGQTLGIVNFYYNADKIFNICKGFPIGAITWGSGSIGSSSISTLVKDFRKEITKEKLCEGQYKLEEVARRFVKFIYDDHYNTAFMNWKKKPDIGFIIAGYGASVDYVEEWLIEVTDGKLKGPERIRGENETGITWSGEPEAITRLYLGHGSILPDVLLESGIEPNKVSEIMHKVGEKLRIPMVLPPLPIQDAIDLAEFLVGTTINFSKFSPGPTSVGGPVDIAVITKHEGFKWIKRKHYYNNELNPLPISSERKKE